MATHALPAGTVDLWFAVSDEAEAFEIGEVTSVSAVALAAALNLAQITDPNGVVAAIVAAIQIGKPVTLTAKIEVQSDELADYLETVTPNRWGVLVLKFSNGVTAQIGAAVSQITSGSFGQFATTTMIATASRLPVVTAGDAPPSNLTLPTITGEARVGQSLSASNGTWSGGPTSYTYQWRHADTDADINGATSANYTLVSGDLGSTIEVVVTAVNTNGSTPATSAATSAVIPIAPVNSAAPTISGTAQEGQTLTATTGTWSGSPSFAYQWRWADSNTPIAGATSNTYVPDADDIGHTLAVTVTATNAGGSASASSSATSSVTAASIPVPANTVAPAISGTAQVGETLTCSNGTWTNSPTGYSRQWRWADTNAPISGATGATYDVQASDVGHTLACTVTASNAGGSGSPASSSATSAVLPLAPVNTVPPAVTGTAQVGETLTCSTGTWDNSPVSYAYQWRWADTDAAISGATSSTYDPVEDDIGHPLLCTVTATNAGGSTAEDSNETEAVEAAGGFEIAGLPIYSAGVRETQAGTSNTPIVVIGDSTARGYGGNSATLTVNDTSVSWPTELMRIFAERYSIECNSSSTFGNGDNTSNDPRQLDNRVIYANGAWTIQSAGGVGAQSLGGYVFRSGGTANWAFSPLNKCDTFDVYTIQNTTGVTIIPSVNNVDQTAIPANFANNQPGNIIKTTISAALGRNAIGLRASTSAFHYLSGVVAYNSAVKEVQIINGGWSGARSADYTANTYDYNMVNMVGMLGAKLGIICLGINDARDGVSKATFKANIQTIITALVSAGMDVQLMIPTPIGDGNQGALDTLCTAYGELATENDLAAPIDLRVPFVNYATANGNGWMRDTLHPNATGYAVVAEYIADTLCPGSAILPGAVQGLTVGTITGGTVNVSWSAPSSGGKPRSYKVQYKEASSGTWLDHGIQIAPHDRYAVTGLGAATEHDIRVIATNSAGDGPAAEVSATTIAAPAVLDTFTDTAGTALNAHTGEIGATWAGNTAQSGSTTNFPVISADDLLYRAFANTSLCHYASGSPAADGYALCVIKKLPGSQAETIAVCGRSATGALTFYMARWNAGFLELIKSVTGTQTPLNTYLPRSWADYSTHTIETRMNGTSISIVVDDEVIASATDAGIASAGKASIRTFSNPAQTATSGHLIDYIEAA